MASPRTSLLVLLLTGLLALTVTLGGGCSDSTDPEDGPGPAFTDVPVVPEPTTPGGETGTSSDTLTVIAPLTTHYRPVVRAAYARWSLATRCCEKPPFVGNWICQEWQIMVGMPAMWSHELPMLDVDRCASNTDIDPEPVSAARPDPWERFLLVEDGQIITPAAGASGEETLWHWDGGIVEARADCQLTWQTEPLSEIPHLRRDRYWVRKTLEGGAGNFLLLIGETQGEVSSSYTSGSSVTETEEFGRSVTASAGLNLGALSLGVEVTLSQSFSTAVEVTEESSETFTKTVWGEEGKVKHFQVWELVEEYTITDAEGRPFTDPQYEFVTSQFTRHGVAVSLVSTSFDR